MSAPQSDPASLSLARLSFQGGSYDGLSRGGLPHSFGALKNADGSRFVGEWNEGDFVLGHATRPGDLKCSGQFNENFQLHGLGSTVNFLGVAQNGDYHKDVFKTACALPADHLASVAAAIAAAEAKCSEAQSAIASYSNAAPRTVQPRDLAATLPSRAVPNANTQALMEAAAARDAEIARRVAQADATRLHGARMAQLQTIVDDFITADRQFLQLPGGMEAWERGFVHEYAGSKGLHHPTTEVSPGDRRVTLAKPMRAQDQPPVFVQPPTAAGSVDDVEAPELFMDNIFTLDVMEEPVIATDGFTYEKRCILEWFRTKRTSPTTGAALLSLLPSRHAPCSTNLIPNHSLKSQINQWREALVRAGHAQPSPAPAAQPRQPPQPAPQPPPDYDPRADFY